MILEKKKYLKIKNKEKTLSNKEYYWELKIRLLRSIAFVLFSPCVKQEPDDIYDFNISTVSSLLFNLLINYSCGNMSSILDVNSSLRCEKNQQQRSFLLCTLTYLNMYNCQCFVSFLLWSMIIIKVFFFFFSTFSFQPIKIQWNTIIFPHIYGFLFPEHTFRGQIEIFLDFSIFNIFNIQR